MPARSSSSAPVDELFADPQHPYTVGLLGSIPRLGRRAAHLATIEGMVPNLANAAARLPLFRARVRSPSRAASPRRRRSPIVSRATPRAASGRRWRALVA